MSRRVSVPVAAEGRMWTANDAKRAMAAGAQYVVVGSAITRPQRIAEKFVQALDSFESSRFPQVREQSI